MGRGLKRGNKCNTCLGKNRDAHTCCQAVPKMSKLNIQQDDRGATHTANEPSSTPLVRIGMLHRGLATPIMLNLAGRSRHPLSVTAFNKPIHTTRPHTQLVTPVVAAPVVKAGSRQLGRPEFHAGLTPNTQYTPRPGKPINFQHTSSSVARNSCCRNSANTSTEIQGLKAHT